MFLRARKLLIFVTALLPVGCILALAAAALSNLGLPEKSIDPAYLSLPQKALLAELYHLRQDLGDQVWPGFGSAEIPVVVFNESYVFLVGLDNPPSGWQKVPAGQKRGGDWQPVAGDDFQGRLYYRQPLTDPALTPEAYTVRIGSHWAASLQTKEWLEIEFRTMLKSELPSGISSLVPYRLVVPIFLRGSDGYIASLVHESFHAYQGTAAAGKLEEAEQSALQHAASYPWADPDFQADWQVELDLLEKALKSASGDEARQITAEFLTRRAARRQAAALSPELISYERQREWAEGLARYAELALWKAGADTSGYQASEELSLLTDFRGYSGFPQRWAQELDQMGRMAGSEGDGRFYYSGMGQAFLLDRFAQGWKNRPFEAEEALEDLLQAAVE